MCIHATVIQWHSISPVVTVYLNQKLNENKKISSQIKQNERRGRGWEQAKKNPTGIFCQSFDFFVRLINANEREEVKQAANRHERR